MPETKHLWITYSWKDNEDGDVDFIASQLKAAGLQPHLDRWDLHAGLRLWEQIDGAIANREACDAWLIVASQNSLSSEPCREEVAYALNQALSVRGSSFPMIALFLGAVETTLLPQSLSTRLCVSSTDPDWKERIVAAITGRTPRIQDAHIEPYALTVHDLASTPFAGGPFGYAIEVRPRAGIWAPFIVAIPFPERDRVGMTVNRGARGAPTPNVMKSGPPQQQVGEYWVELVREEASPVHSYYIWCRELPSRLRFGAEAGPQYDVTL